MLNIGNGKSVGLGDYTILTAIAKQCDCVVEMPPEAAKYAVLFSDLAPVQITENPAELPAIEGGDDIWIRDKMRWLNKEHDLSLNVDEYMPFIRPSVEALMWAQKRYAGIACAIKANCSIAHAETRQCAVDKWPDIIEKLPYPKAAIAQFGVSTNVTPLPGIIHELDLPLDRLIAAYAVIGRYVGVDTGDLHVALATGCKCMVFHPGECDRYRFHRWEYPHNNVRYVHFQNMGDVNAGDLSDFLG